MTEHIQAKQMNYDLEWQAVLPHTRILWWKAEGVKYEYSIRRDTDLAIHAIKRNTQECFDLGAFSTADAAKRACARDNLSNL